MEINKHKTWCHRPTTPEAGESAERRALIPKPVTSSILVSQSIENAPDSKRAWSESSARTEWADSLPSTTLAHGVAEFSSGRLEVFATRVENWGLSDQGYWTFPPDRHTRTVLSHTHALVHTLAKFHTHQVPHCTQYE